MTPVHAFAVWTFHAAVGNTVVPLVGAWSVLLLALAIVVSDSPRVINFLTPWIAATVACGWLIASLIVTGGTAA